MARLDPRLSTLSFLVAASVVFAPAPTSTPDSGDASSSGVAIAAQMLAPTVDQGLAGEGRLAVAKRVVYEREKRSVGTTSSAAVLISLCLLLASTFVCALRPHRSSSHQRIWASPTVGRAPPCLLPA